MRWLASWISCGSKEFPLSMVVSGKGGKQRRERGRRSVRVQRHREDRRCSIEFSREKGESLELFRMETVVFRCTLRALFNCRQDTRVKCMHAHKVDSKKVKRKSASSALAKLKHF